MENGVSKAGAEAKTDHVVDWLAVFIWINFPWITTELM
jgi:hypothetical protein